MTTTGQGAVAPVALVTGGSKGLGRALARRLVAEGWHVVIDARGGDGLRRATEGLPATRVTAIPGDVSDGWHRARLAVAVADLGRLDLLVNNASVLGPTPLSALADLLPAELERVLAVNTIAPLALAQMVVEPLERSGGRIVNVSSDAAVAAYEGWGGYGASKAALDLLTAVLAVEHPRIRAYSMDPGDMATDLHQQAYPGEDISDRPTPESVVPAFMRLVEGDLPSGRYAVDALAPVHGT
jgi:NAD(P)-dependent dehydrogenase (short-subunit alcohol dehydrogenase family)